MHEAANLTLSDSELLFVQDKQFILAKQHIISIVFDMFSVLAKNLHTVFHGDKEKLPAEMLFTVPKIYKGENYNNFPYVMLDYPAVFAKENILALRHMFWWGNYFSVTLHVSGKYKKQYEQSILKNIINGKEEYYLCVNENQWEHHFQSDNYVRSSSKDGKGIIEIFEKPFLKVALQYPFFDWENMLLNLEKGSIKLINLLAD